MIDYARVLAEAGELEQALEQADLAIAINPDLAMGYMIRGTLLHVYRGELIEAIPLHEQAYRISPESPLIVAALSDALIDLGYFDRAGALIDKTMPHTPKPTIFTQMRVSMLTLQGDHVGAAASARAVLDYLPNVPWAIRILRDQHIREHEHEKGLELYKRSYAPLLDESSETVDLVGWQIPVAIDLSVLLKKMGRTELAARLLAAVLDKTERLQQQRIGPPSIRAARIHALLGNTDSAVNALQQAVDAGWRNGWQLQLYHDAALDSLRDLPEFQALVARVEADIERQRRELEARYENNKEG